MQAIVYPAPSHDFRRGFGAPRGGHGWWSAAGVCLLATLAGCTADPPQFRPNLVEMRLQEKAASEPISAPKRQEIADVLLALFGTPDDPDAASTTLAETFARFDANKDGHLSLDEFQAWYNDRHGAAAKGTAKAERKSAAAQRFEKLDADHDKTLSLQEFTTGIASDPAESTPSLLTTFGFDVQKLKIAAGRVYSEESGRQHGLFRLHCAHCHGLTGDGAGPTALFLNPYPRDYRPGKFKFKSTLGDEKPTRADLIRILTDGIPGTAMPTFRVLPENERDILVEYVEYLSIRGQTELRLIELVASGEPIPEPAVLAGGFPLKADSEGNPVEPSKDNIVASLVQKWRRSAKYVVAPPVPAPKIANETARLASLARGRELFYNNVAACYKCHGDSQLGDGQLDYDSWFQWRKDLEQKPAAERDKDVDEMLALGALPPRMDKPRDLRVGAYRGGRRPLDIYRRIFSGINGTPMPKASVVAAGPDGKPLDPNAGMTAEDIWHLVNYVKSLPYEPLSQPPHPRKLDSPDEHKLQ